MKKAGDMSCGGITKSYNQGDMSSVDTAGSDGKDQMGAKGKVLGDQATSSEPTMMKKGANPSNDWDKISKMANNKDMFYNF